VRRIVFPQAVVYNYRFFPQDRYLGRLSGSPIGRHGARPQRQQEQRGRSPRVNEQQKCARRL
jgi:hypothetical protein